jgi:uncharacterized membrane protein YkoI
MRLSHAVIATALTVGLSTCAPPEIDPVTGDAVVVEEQPGFFSMAAIGPDSATHLAKIAVPGKITKAVLERERGVLLYSFDIQVEGEAGKTEIHVDAGNGSLLSREHEGD